MRSAILFLLLLLNISTLGAQNVNTTFRSKLTYPGQTLANVWGYVSRGHEYALVGGALGLIIVDITNPDVPQQIVQIPGPNNLWKEIKTYSHYAYVTSEGGQGIQIVDLTELPGSVLPWKFYKGDGAIANQLNAIHALHIDEKKGYLYAWGGDLFGGGAKIFDIKTDPWNPKYVGKYDALGYIHDGYVDNDTMYSGHIYAGQFAVVNMADKSNPELINTQGTPGAFTHNTWLANDRKTLLSTDEVNNSFLTAFDVSNPDDIRQLDKIQSNPGTNSMVHNTYVRDNWAITSWYKDGFTIVDITRPENLVQVGNHDTYPGGGGGSEGCWGVYHNFPSGNIIASNISVNGAGELWIVTPNYVRACYLEGTVTNAITGLPINGATIQIVGSNPNTQESSALNGQYKMGQLADGFYKVQVSRSGYQTFETDVLFQRGEVVFLDVALYPNGLVDLSGTVVQHLTGNPVEGATVWLYSGAGSSSATTDANGAFAFSNILRGAYNIAASAPDLSMGILSNQSIVTDSTVTITLYPTFRKEEIGATPHRLLDQLKVLENPFATETTLKFHAATAVSRLEIHNAQGQFVQEIQVEPGIGEVRLGTQWPTGIYMVRLIEGNEVVSVQKLIKQ
ncbi:MAG: choice-of-anchor B family protein [Chitinophagales bacterium]|nr:choice-of-anchor B family protein [Chitinophagales bacterium]